jgi:hypothetical protein
MRAPRFRLRTLLLITCCSGAVIGCATRYAGSVLTQRHAVLALKSRGAQIRYDFSAGFLQEPEIQWLKRSGGEDWFYSVESIAFYDRPAGCEELELIVRLRGVRELTFFESDLVDQDLACLTRLKSLKRLRIAGSPLGNEALRILAQAPSLEDLALDGERVTEVGLAEISRFPHLHSFVLHRGCVPARSASALRRRLPHCRIVVSECFADREMPQDTAPPSRRRYCSEARHPQLGALESGTGFLVSLRIEHESAKPSRPTGRDQVSQGCFCAAAVIKSRRRFAELDQQAQ